MNIAKLTIIAGALVASIGAVAEPPSSNPGDGVGGLSGPGNSGAAQNIGDVLGVESDVNCLGDLRSGSAQVEDGQPGVGEIVAPRQGENANTANTLFFVGAIPAVVLGVSDCGDIFP